MQIVRSIHGTDWRLRVLHTVSAAMGIVEFRRRLQAAPDISAVDVAFGDSCWMPAVLYLTLAEQDTELRWQVRLVSKAGQVDGPFSGRQLITLWQNGELDSRHQVSLTTERRWMAVSEDPPIISDRPSSPAALEELAHGPRRQTWFLLGLSAVVFVIGSVCLGTTVFNRQRLNASLRAAEAWVEGDTGMPPAERIRRVETAFQRWLALPTRSEWDRLNKVKTRLVTEERRQQQLEAYLKEAATALENPDSTVASHLSQLRQQIQRTIEEKPVLFLSHESETLPDRAAQIQRQLRTATAGLAGAFSPPEHRHQQSAEAARSHPAAGKAVRSSAATQPLPLPVSEKTPAVSDFASPFCGTWKGYTSRRGLSRKVRTTMTVTATAGNRVRGTIEFHDPDSRNFFSGHCLGRIMTLTGSDGESLSAVILNDHLVGTWGTEESAVGAFRCSRDSFVEVRKLVAVPSETTVLNWRLPPKRPSPVSGLGGLFEGLARWSAKHDTPTIMGAIGTDYERRDIALSVQEVQKRYAYRNPTVPSVGTRQQFHAIMNFLLSLRGSSVDIYESGGAVCRDARLLGFQEFGRIIYGAFDLDGRSWYLPMSQIIGIKHNGQFVYGSDSGVRLSSTMQQQRRQFMDAWLQSCEKMDAIARHGQEELLSAFAEGFRRAYTGQRSSNAISLSDLMNPEQMLQSSTNSMTTSGSSAAAANQATSPDHKVTKLRIHGRIVRSDNRNEGVKNLKVTLSHNLTLNLNRPQTYTDADGRFELNFEDSWGTDAYYTLWIDDRKFPLGRISGSDFSVPDIQW